MSENLVIIEGFLGQDPELKYTPEGTPVCNMSVATNQYWKEGDDQKESTTWHAVETWRKLAENCANHLKKGSRIYLRGQLVNKKWEPAEGVTAIKTVVRAKKVTFL